MRQKHQKQTKTKKDRHVKLNKMHEVLASVTNLRIKVSTNDAEEKISGIFDLLDVKLTFSMKL